MRGSFFLSMKNFLFHLRRNINILRHKSSSIRKEGIFCTAAKVAVQESFPAIAKLDYGKDEIFMQVRSGLQLHRLTACKKEPRTVLWLESQKGHIFYDIGANVGAYSLIAARRGFKVYAFEPSFSTFAALNENIFLNQANSAITAFCIALGNETGVIDFGYHSILAGDSGHTLAFDKKKLMYKTQAYRLDDFIMQWKIPVPHCVKIDVDGYEYAVLEGMKRTLACPELKSLMIEVFNDKKGQVDAVLAELGWYEIKEQPWAFEKPLTNCVYARRENV